MKNILNLVVLIFLSFNTLYAQKSADVIKIYSIPFNTSYVSEQYTTANNVRVNYNFFICIKDSYLIEDVLKEYQSIKKEKVLEKSKKENWGCRIVVDFIKNAKITESVVFHTRNLMSFDEPFSISTLYKTDETFLCFLNNHFPSIINANESDIKCSCD